MSEKENKIVSTLDGILKDPLKLAGAVIGATAVLGIFAIHMHFEVLPTHGARAHLSPESALAMKGQEVYMQEGCQYCHSQNLRSLDWEVARFADADAYGYYPLPHMMEYYFEAPSMRGSERKGPDLSRLAGSMNREDLEGLLQSTKSDTLRAGHHRFGHLFQSEAGMSPLFLSWRVRMMMNARAPLSDSYQKSVFEQLDGQTRGDALVEYLLTLGRKQSEFAGKYFQ
ncbi:MAG: cbb3-type cytochrome c oxidase subunit II [bacterium]|nr:cbb3-type cytochrome c oxidase subunit II [bacterium]